MHPYELKDPNTGKVLATVEVVCQYRAIIYNDYLLQVYKDLRSISTNGKFTTALQDIDLLSSFANIADQYVASGVMADFNQCRNYLYEETSFKNNRGEKFFTSNKELIQRAFFNLPNKYVPVNNKSEQQNKQAYLNYFNWAIENEVQGNGMKEKGINAFFNRNQRTKYALNKVKLHFVENVNLLIERLIEDWRLINKIFLGNPWDSWLTKIQSTGSDFHKGGKQVLILTFSKSLEHYTGNSETVKVVYKPGDIEVDSYLVGKIQKLDKSIKSELSEQIGLDKSKASSLGKVNNSRQNYFLEKKSMSELLNEELTDDCPLPTYKILPRFPGSLFDTQTTSPNIPVRASYGYIEFLTTGDKQNLEGTQKEAENFYKIWGGLIAMARLFSLADLHNENVIVHNKMPFLIDLEDGFKKPISSINDTGIFNVNFGSIDGIQLYNDFKYVIDDDQSGQLEITSNMQKRPKNELLPRLYKDVENGELFDYEGFEEYVVRVYIKVLNYLKDNNTKIEVWLKSLEPCTTRYVAEGTDVLMNSISEAFGYLNCEHPTPDPSNYQSTFGKGPDFKGGLSWNNLNKSLLWTDNNNYRDFANLDVPFYIHRLDDANLYNSEGNIVNAKKNTPKTYLPDSSMKAVKDQIKNAPEQKLIYEVEHELNLSLEKFGESIRNSISS